MAVAVEDSARDFYNKLREKFPQHGGILGQLASDEENHAKRYKELLASGEVVYSTGEERALADFNIKTLE